MRSEEVVGLRGEIRRANRRTILAILGAGLLIGASLGLGAGGEPVTMLWGAPIWTWNPRRCRHLPGIRGVVDRRGRPLMEIPSVTSGS